MKNMHKLLAKEKKGLQQNDYYICMYYQLKLSCYKQGAGMEGNSIW